MKKFLLLIILVSFFISSKSQDIIEKNDGTIIKAFIKEAKPEYIKYVKFNNPDGPIYVIKSSLVKKIQYENGVVEYFSGSGQNSEIKIRQSYPPFVFKKNIIYYHLIDVFYKDFTLSYEYIFDNQKIGLQFPIGIGFNVSSTSLDIYNTIYSGIGVNYYIPKLDRISYLTGFDLRFGLGASYHDEYKWGTFYQSEVVKEKTLYSKLLINNAVVFNPLENISFMAKLGIGVKYLEKETHYAQKGLSSTAHFSINFGIRF